MKDAELYEIFLNGGTKGKSSSLSIVDNALISYSTPIARLQGDTVFLNTKKYSVTTSKTHYDKKVSLVKAKASLKDFIKGLKRAETKTRVYAKQQWGNKEKWEDVNWKEIYDNTMAEEY
jgi:hypothetical protein